MELGLQTINALTYAWIIWLLLSTCFISISLFLKKKELRLGSILFGVGFAVGAIIAGIFNGVVINVIYWIIFYAITGVCYYLFLKTNNIRFKIAIIASLVSIAVAVIDYHYFIKNGWGFALDIIVPIIVFGICFIPFFIISHIELFIIQSKNNKQNVDEGSKTKSDVVFLDGGVTFIEEEITVTKLKTVEQVNKTEINNTVINNIEQNVENLKVEIIKEENKPALEVNEEDADEEEEIEEIPSNNRKKIERIPFTTRLEKADDNLRNNYYELRDELLAYDLKSRISKYADKYHLSRKTYVKIVIIGKTLKFYFALDPKKYTDSPIPVGDVSNKNAYKDIPLTFKVKSPLSVKRCKKLISDLGLEKKKKVEEAEKVEIVTTIDALENTDTTQDEIVIENGKKIRKPRVPFIVKLENAEDSLKDNYYDLKNELLKKGLKSRISIGGDTYRLHRKPYVKMNIVGKTLKVYYALNPNDYVQSPIPTVDVSEKKLYSEIPTLLKVKSNLSVKRAKKLIDDLHLENVDIKKK